MSQLAADGHLQGLVYWQTESPDGSPRSYWGEGDAYLISEAEVDAAEGATSELVRLYREATTTILEQDWLDRFDIPREAWLAIRASWERGDLSVAGRFDVGWAGTTWKLIEFNADAAAMLLESALIQLAWAIDAAPGYGQFNLLHDALIERWAEIPRESKVWFASSLEDEEGEDFINTNYMRICASLGKHETGVTVMDDVAWREGGFWTRDERAETVWKMYGWDFMVHDQLGALALRSVTEASERTRWFEPIWRYLWQSKAMLAVLWELYPDHPLLLPAYLDGPRDMADWVRKSPHGYEGPTFSFTPTGWRKRLGATTAVPKRCTKATTSCRSSTGGGRSGRVGSSVTARPGCACARAKIESPTDTPASSRT